MKIECDKCAAKYSIADEKVRGKTFKIRCKKCSNVIIVRDKGGAAAAAATAVPAADHAPGWHLAINGETVGPMAEDEVRQRYDAGEIDRETAVWQEGFEDWVPIGDVDVFADLPEAAAAAPAAAAAAEDPFTSANQDDYAAPAAVGAGVAAPMEQARSPRVSQLTGQRNENSVLFSLDSLQSLATSGGGGAAAAAAAAPAPAAAAARVAANPAKGLATAAPSSEGSGLIDIRALGAMVGGAGAAVGGTAVAAHGAADDAALPSFGGGLGGLTAAPLIAPVATPDPAALAAAAPVAAQPRSQAPLYIMMAFLLIAVMGLVAFVVLREPETKIVKETVTVPGAAPSVKDSGKDDDGKDDGKDDDGKDDAGKDDDGKDDAGKDDDGKDDDGEDGKAADDGEGDAGDAKPATNTGSTAKKKGKGGKKKVGKAASSSSGDPLADALGGETKSKSSGKKSGGGGDPGIDCILDPSKCGSGSKKKSTKSKPSGGTDPSLPETLTSGDIKAGVASHKAAAKACGAKHGGTAGEKVTIKLSISGGTGKVTSAAATGKHAGTALGNCVAQALRKAKFSKFKKSSLGVRYPIRL